MLTFWYENRAIIQYAAIALLAAACWIWGGGPERLAAVVLVTMPVSSVTYYYVFGSELHLTHTDLGNAAMQVMFAAALLAIALYANRRYTLWLAAFQFVVVVLHLTRNLLPATAERAYLILTVVPSYGLIVTLCAGLVAHLVRVRRFGSYRSWR